MMTIPHFVFENDKKMGLNIVNMLQSDSDWGVSVPDLYQIGHGKKAGILEKIVGALFMGS